MEIGQKLLVVGMELLTSNASPDTPTFGEAFRQGKDGEAMAVPPGASKAAARMWEAFYAAGQASLTAPIMTGVIPPRHDPGQAWDEADRGGDLADYEETVRLARRDWLDSLTG